MLVDSILCYRLQKKLHSITLHSYLLQFITNGWMFRNYPSEISPSRTTFPINQYQAYKTHPMHHGGMRAMFFARHTHEHFYSLITHNGKTREIRNLLMCHLKYVRIVVIRVPVASKMEFTMRQSLGNDLSCRAVSN